MGYEFDDRNLTNLFSRADQIGNAYQTFEERRVFQAEFAQAVNAIADEIDEEFIDIAPAIIHYRSRSLPEITPENLREKTLKELFRLADEIGGHHYHRLTRKDFREYRKFDHWRYIHGCRQGKTTFTSKAWVGKNSKRNCPVCGQLFTERGGKTIDHKLPRSQYPWFSINFNNFWVICGRCNSEKGEMHWYQYEHHIFVHASEHYENVRKARPKRLLKSLSDLTHDNGFPYRAQ